MLRKAFLNHPATVNETYGEHFFQAMRFSLKLLSGGIACLVHAFVPCLFISTARNTVIRLNDILVLNRQNQTPLRRSGSGSSKG